MNNFGFMPGGITSQPRFPFSGMFGQEKNRPNGARGRFGNFNNNNIPVCQLCGKQGHLVSKCWYRFNQNYQPNVQQNNNTSNDQFSSTNTHAQQQ